MKFSRNVLVFVGLACLSLSAQQITGSIRGTVIDPLGAVVQGATVTVQQSETGLSRSVTTDRNGGYVVLELPVGHYRLQVTAKGFQEYVQDGISVNVNEAASVSPHLAVGSEIKVVQVTADAELIAPTVTSMGKVVGERELEDLPLNGRNFSQLGLLQPGVVPITPGLVEAAGGLRDGQPYAVRYQYLSTMLLNEVQKQAAVIHSQQQEIESLKRQLQGQNASLQERLARLEKVTEKQPQTVAMKEAR